MHSIQYRSSSPTKPGRQIQALRPWPGTDAGLPLKPPTGRPAGAIQYSSPIYGSADRRRPPRSSENSQDPCHCSHQPEAAQNWQCRACAWLPAPRWWMKVSSPSSVSPTTPSLNEPHLHCIYWFPCCCCAFLSPTTFPGDNTHQYRPSQIPCLLTACKPKQSSKRKRVFH